MSYLARQLATRLLQPPLYGVAFDAESNLKRAAGAAKEYVRIL